MSTARFSRLALSAALLFAGACAQASPVSLNLSGFSLGSENIDTSMSGFVGVGQFKGTMNDGSGSQSFLTFCTDIYQSFSWNTNYQYDLVANGSTNGFTAAQADLLGRLYTRAGAIDTTTKSVAFQLSIWEILYDTTQTLSLTADTFKLDSGGSTAVRDQASAWLTGLSGVNSQYQVQRLYNASTQDFIVAQRVNNPTHVGNVPEPASIALTLTALAALAMASRRRKAR